MCVVVVSVFVGAVICCSMHVPAQRETGCCRARQALGCSCSRAVGEASPPDRSLSMSGTASSWLWAEVRRRLDARCRQLCGGRGCGRVLALYRRSLGFNVASGLVCRVLVNKCRATNNNSDISLCEYLESLDGCASEVGPPKRVSSTGTFQTVRTHLFRIPAVNPIFASIALPVSAHSSTSHTRLISETMNLSQPAIDKHVGCCEYRHDVTKYVDVGLTMLVDPATSQYVLTVWHCVVLYIECWLLRP